MFSNLTNRKKIEQFDLSGFELVSVVSIFAPCCSIGNKVFSHYSSLIEIIAPTTLTQIGSYAFTDCKLLTKIQIPKWVKLIGSYAFSGII